AIAHPLPSSKEETDANLDAIYLQMSSPLSFVKSYNQNLSYTLFSQYWVQIYLFFIRKLLK
ncbi:MAG: hypothetical protein K2G91_03840, partial [Prevotella sp.]|nr:hypothetical protein [Prevotella sp.]